MASLRRNEFPRSKFCFNGGETRCGLSIWRVGIWLPRGNVKKSAPVSVPAMAGANKIVAFTAMDERD